MAMSTERIACIRHAWESFLASGRDPAEVRPSIAASWRRSRLSGVPAEDAAFPYRPAAGTSRLMSAAEPVLNRFAMSLPGTHSVSLDSQRRCIAVNVQGVGDGRLAELVLRGVAVPRRAVLLGLVN